MLRAASRLERLLSAADQLVSEEPVPGSRMDRAQQTDLRDGYDLARACIFSAEDHLRTVLAFLRPEPPLTEVILPQFSLYTLLRAACTADVRARHLLDLGITETRRLARALNERLRQALAELPERRRMAVVLFDVEGYSHGEIALILGIPEGTVRSEVFHARRRLRVLLVDWKEEG